MGFLRLTQLTPEKINRLKQIKWEFVYKDFEGFDGNNMVFIEISLLAGLKCAGVFSKTGKVISFACTDSNIDTIGDALIVCRRWVVRKD